jgi:signal peptidase I
MTVTKRRRPLLAFFLSLGCPGLGQLYNGSWRWAAGAWAIGSLITYFSAVYLFDTFSKLMQALLLGLFLDLFFGIHAWFQARQLGTMELKPFQRWWVYILFAVVLYGSPGGFGYIIPERFLSFQIPSESMVPTLLVGDRLVADGWAYRNDSPRRGDIIVFDYPRDPSIKYVKRVVGLPGDQVQIVGGELYVNKVVVNAHRTSDPSQMDDGWGVVEYMETLGDVKHVIRRAQPTMFLNYGPVTVPEKSYFVMGDNRDRSSDSRVWGFVPEAAIVGKMRYVYFSWDGEKGGIRWPRISQPVE